MDRLNISGFDSAWGGTQRGAICDLWIDKQTGDAQIDAPPESVSWPDAIRRVRHYAQFPHHILAVDQGVVVPNQLGMRPVERTLATALANMECSAYPSNRSNAACYGPSAGIWAFLSALDGSGYVNRPMSIPRSTSGRFYFECYPHPAIIALLNTAKVLKYKCRHRNQQDWDRLIDFLKGLPIRNMPDVVDSLRVQNKVNEDKLDAVVCAYAAILWWRYGTAQSSMLGDIDTGYIVTPHNDTTLGLFRRAFSGRMNIDSGISPAYPVPVAAPAQLPPVAHVGSATDSRSGVPQNGWAGAVELIATDTTNLWRNRKGRVANAWLDLNRFSGYRLTVKFVQEDAEPEVEFGPFNGSDVMMGFMRNGETQPGLWTMLVAGATRTNPLTFPVVYRYDPMGAKFPLP
jgi:predicted RNase H-like nuclease